MVWHSDSYCRYLPPPDGVVFGAILGRPQRASLASGVDALVPPTELDRTEVRPLFRFGLAQTEYRGHVLRTSEGLFLGLGPTLGAHRLGGAVSLTVTLLELSATVRYGYVPQLREHEVTAVFEFTDLQTAVAKQPWE